jgi:hypothetical protein
MKPDIKLYDDHIEIEGTIKGDINKGVNVDIDADVDIEGDVEIDGDVNINSDVGITGKLKLLDVTLQNLGRDLIIDADLLSAGKLHATSITAGELTLTPGLNGQVTVAFYTKWDPIVGGYLAKNLYLKPDGILLTTAFKDGGATSFDLLPEFNALIARVDALEKSLNQQICKEAYRRWEAGGRKSGRALEDWLAAERDILGQ